jgi:PrtD family type I secretion system ABC transporter
MLSLLALLALVLGYFLDSVRAEALAWAGRALDRYLSPQALAGSLQHAAMHAGTGNTDALRDVSAMRTFLGSAGVLALFDLPWVPVYLLVITLMHPLLGLTATVGACLLTGLAAATEKLTRAQTEDAQLRGRSTSELAQALTRNAEVIVGMGMMQEALTAWGDRHQDLLRAQEQLSHRSVRLGAVARMGRQVLQIGMLALGAWLVIDAQASPGIMIAATILLGRALQPVEQLIGGWKALIEGRGAWARLRKRTVVATAIAVELPVPAAKLELERVVHTWTPGRAPFIRGITLQVEPGESLGIIGPSAAGKTTLIRLMLGIWKPQSGVVRLDGADVAQWDRHALGKHIGYLPQDVELFAGSVARNIARLRPVDSAAVLEAAQLAHAHEMIVRLPEGYDTEIGQGGAILSGGQRQRIALARALYGNPRFVVLDEPNANLDAEGELALSNTIKALKERGTTVVIVGHRSNLMSQLDKLAILRDGCLEAFGRSEAVLSRLGAVVRPLHRVHPVQRDAVEAQG